MDEEPTRKKRIYGDDGREYDSVVHETAVLRLERAAPDMLAALVVSAETLEAAADLAVIIPYNREQLLAAACGARTAIAKAKDSDNG